MRTGADLKKKKDSLETLVQRTSCESMQHLAGVGNLPTNPS